AGTVCVPNLANFAPYRAELRARREGRALETCEDPAPKVGKVRVVGRADHQPRGRAIGNDVRGLSTVGDDPVDPRIAANEKTERRHGIPTEHKAVERVHAVL